ncbi:MAG: hypothetical protein PUF65_00115 [Lachnospiraceae bacterium]|nr:hypothetical protein [Lachnospiraceae bacterium]
MRKRWKERGKKMATLLLSFVMLFSLTMPAMAAEVTGDTEGDVSGTFNPEIMFTDIEISSSFATRYDDSNGTYIAVIQPGKKLQTLPVHTSARIWNISKQTIHF